MTLEDAKEILKKEGWTDFKKLSYRPKGLKQPKWEKPIVVQALETCYDNHVLPLILKDKLSERLGRLKAEYEKQRPDYEKINQIVDELIEEEGTSGVGMSLQDAKEILIKKGYSLNKVTDCQSSQVDYFVDKVLKCAVATVNANGYMVSYDETVNVTTQEYVDAIKKLNDPILGDQAKKTKVIAKKNKKIASLKKSIKEKDEVIDTISEELRLSKVREEELLATVKDYLALVVDKDEEIAKLKKQLAKYKRGHFVKQEFMPYWAQYRDNHNIVVTEKLYNKKNIFTGVDVGSDEGDKVYVGAFAIYNEVPICKDPLTVDELIEIQKKLFRKSPF